MFEKDFDEWNTLKKKIEKRQKLPLVKQRDIWWCNLGVNVGGEICGKNGDVSRPVLVLQKIFSNLAIVVPLTSQSKTGFWYVPVSVGDKTGYVCIHQIKAMDYKRFTRKISRLDEQDFQAVLEKINRLTNIQEK